MSIPSLRPRASTRCGRRGLGSNRQATEGRPRGSAGTAAASEVPPLGAAPGAGGCPCARRAPRPGRPTGAPGPAATRRDRDPQGRGHRRGVSSVPESGAAAATSRARPLRARRPRHLARGGGEEGRSGSKETGRKPRTRQPLSAEARERRLPAFPPPAHPETFPTHAGVFLTGFGGPESPSGRRLRHQTRPPSTRAEAHGTPGGTRPLGRRPRAWRQQAAPQPKGTPRAREPVLKTCKSAAAQRGPGLCVTLPTAPPRAKASPRTHTLTHPAPPRRLPELAFVFQWQRKIGQFEPKREGCKLRKFPPPLPPAPATEGERRVLPESVPSAPLCPPVSSFFTTVD